MVFKCGAKSELNLTQPTPYLILDHHHHQKNLQNDPYEEILYFVNTCFHQLFEPDNFCFDDIARYFVFILVIVVVIVIFIVIVTMTNQSGSRNGKNLSKQVGISNYGSNMIKKEGTKMFFSIHKSVTADL